MGNIQRPFILFRKIVTIVTIFQQRDIWAERSLRDESESVITTAERVEVIEIEHDVRKTPSSTYFGDYHGGDYPAMIR